MYKDDNKCPICGCTEIGQGKLQGYADMMAMKWWKGHSKVIAQICTQCGFILSMKVEKPQIFSSKEKK